MKQNEDDRLIEVSDMNNNKGALNQSEATKNENEEQISYIISRQTSQDESRAINEESTSLIFS